MKMPCVCGSCTVKLSFIGNGVELFCHACGAKVGEVDEEYDKEENAMKKMEPETKGAIQCPV